MRVGVLFIVLWLVAACSVPQKPDASDPLLYDAPSMARADSAVIGIPGALTSIRVLSPLQEVIAPNRAVGYYRLPGFDGRPDAEWVDIDRGLRGWCAKTGRSALIWSAIPPAR